MTDTSPSPADRIADARAELEAGDSQAAVRAVSPILIDQPDHAEALDVLHAAFDMADYPELADPIAELRTNQNANTWYDAGQALIGTGLAELAIAFFNQAFTLDQHPVIAVALADAYCEVRVPRYGLEVLERVPDCQDAWYEFQLAWTKLLLGDPTAAAQCLEKYSGGDAFGEHTDTVCGKLQQVHDRLVALGKDDMSIRHWHLIQYGSIVTDLMDDSYAEGAGEVAGGRFVYQVFEWAHMRRLLGRLWEIVRRAPVAPQAVVAAEGRDAAILAEAFSLISGLPIVEPSADAKAVFIGANGDDVAVMLVQLGLFDQLRPGQMSYTFNVNWVEPQAVATDVVGVLAQLPVLAWHERMKVRDDAAVEKSPEDARPVAEVAADLANADADDPLLPDFVAWLDSEPVRAAALTFNTVSHRLTVKTDSPVPGMHF